MSEVIFILKKLKVKIIISPTLGFLLVAMHATPDGLDYSYNSAGYNDEKVKSELFIEGSLLSLPTVLTTGPTSITATTATLNGSGNPNGETTTGWFRYSTVNPGTPDDVSGTRAPSSGGTALGSGSSPVAYSQAIEGLLPSTTYYFWAIAQNASGTAFGSIYTFTTSAAAIPTVLTTGASMLMGTSATLNGSGNPNGNATTGWFRYSTVNPGTCNDVFGTRAPLAGGSSLGAGSFPVNYSQVVTGLPAATTCYYCAIAQNDLGTSFGSVQSFVIPAPPNAQTNAPTIITGTSATLNGSGTPNGGATTAWFRYSTIDPGSGDDVSGTRVPASGGTSLGSGLSPVMYSQSITGLIPATTYYFWAIVSNAEGIAFGSVLSFTTLSIPPTVTTTNANLITATTATLNGSANPNNSTTSGWFRYSTVSPGTCNDAFGTRAPASGGAALGSGNSPVAYSQPVTGLPPGTTCYFCAISQNAVGTSFGTVESFTTAVASPPTVVTSSATMLMGSSATLNGSGNPNGDATTGWFRYATVNPGTCNDAFGTREPAAGGTSLGSGNSPVNYSNVVTGLPAATICYYCAIAQNNIGTSFGSIQSFVIPTSPTAQTNAASNITGTTATLNGSGTPNGGLTTAWFRYSTIDPGTGDDVSGTRVPASGGASLGSGTSPVPYSQPITALLPATTYYFWAIVSNPEGISFGSVLSFTTSALPPVVTTNTASSLMGTSATLNGSANPNNNATTGWFRYSTTSPGTCNDVFGTRAPTSGGALLGSGTSSVDYSQVVTGLPPVTTCYYCAIAQNSVGTSFGIVESFIIPALPIALTNAPTIITGTSATLNGSGNPNGAATTAWFRYSTIDPGTGDDVSGTRAPASGGNSLGSGISPVLYSQSIIGLLPATTYYFWAIVSNSEGISFGSVISFTTLALTPAVTTNNASSLSGTTATLNGSANPNNSTTTGWFRYSTTNPGTCNDVFGTRAPASGGASLGSGISPVNYSEVVTGLPPLTTCYYCAIAQNTVGTSFGSVQSFIIPAPPIAQTNAPSIISGTSATLNGSGTPNASATTAWFRYSTINPGTGDDVSGTRAPVSGGNALGSGISPVLYSQPITGLIPSTTYYFWAIVSNAEGISFGSVISFTTIALSPTVNTNSATFITSTTATLNGSANPNNSSTTGWFRYSTTSPGTCNDAFGTRVPGSGGTALGSGTSPVIYSQMVTGLPPATTCYYCAIAQNTAGTSFGSVQSFTTSVAPPAHGSVGIGTINPDTSAVLELSSTTRGFLPPRMTASQRDNIISPPHGLVIYCTDCGGGEVEVYNNFGWTNMVGSVPAGLLAIGDNYAGGKIAYILQPGDPGYIAGQAHGLVAATSDQSTNLLWGCSGTAIPGADGLILGTGNQNTIDIVAGCATPGFAAGICGDLVLNGYSDWYLPSKDELNKLYINRIAIGGFTTGGYWSSSEVDGDNAWFQNFNGGTQISLNKGAPNFVRPVRSF